MRVATRARERTSEMRALAAAIGAHATCDGTTTLAGYPGVHFYRVPAPVRFKKTPILAPRLIVVAQGRKVASFGDRGELAYDEDHYLVVTGEAELEGRVIDATPERPYLAMCMELAPDVVARTLLALAEVEAPRAAPDSGVLERVPAFVSPLTDPIAGAVTRLVAAIDDPWERRVVAPLVVEEIVFRLLRTDAASIVRDAVKRGDAPIALAMKFMRENHARPLTVESVARHVGMSASHFAHRFSAVARVPPMRYLKQVRLECARELMLGARTRVSEAATKVGYESASHFTRDFKVAYGSSPAAFVRIAGSGKRSAGPGIAHEGRDS